RRRPRRLRARRLRLEEPPPLRRQPPHARQGQPPEGVGRARRAGVAAAGRRARRRWRDPGHPAGDLPCRPARPRRARSYRANRAIRARQAVMKRRRYDPLLEAPSRPGRAGAIAGAAYAVLGGILWVLASPPVGLWPLAFVAAAPTLVAIDRAPTPRRAGF